MTGTVRSRVVDKLNDYIERKLGSEGADTIVEALAILICTQAIAAGVPLEGVHALMAEVYAAVASRAATRAVAQLRLVPKEAPEP